MIIHVINSSSGSGGAEQGMVREITRFESEIEQHVAQLYAPDQLAPQVVSTGIIHSTLGLDSFHFGWNWLIGHARLRKVIRDFEPDVVHSCLFSVNLVGRVASQLNKYRAML